MKLAYSLPLAAAALIGCANTVDTPLESPRFSAELYCGQLPVSVSGQGERMQMVVLGEEFELQQRISASGSRYVANTEAENSLWFKGEQASLVLDDMTYPQCAPQGAIVEPFRASGNEPFWLLTLGRGMLELNQLGETEQPAQPYVFDRTTGELQSPGQPSITGQVTDQICRDTMSGMPFPQQVTLQLDNTTLRGCGGDPARLLQGAEWVVEDINGRGIVDRSRVAMSFWDDGRITGHASCNSFMAQYELTGEGLNVNQPVSTRMACAPALMTQEQSVLESLQTMQRFDIDPTGALLLHSANGTLKARLAQ